MLIALQRLLQFLVAHRWDFGLHGGDFFGLRFTRASCALQSGMLEQAAFEPNSPSKTPKT